LSNSRSGGAILNNRINDKSFKHFDCGGKCFTDSTVCGLIGVCPHTRHLVKEVREDVTKS
jgi:hypothetical protein